MTQLRVAVVGAGLAGLSAADALVRAGCDVVVHEARDRVGGRVWSRRLADGSVIEMGAEFVLPGNVLVEQAVRRLGLGVWQKGVAYGRREPRGGGAVTEVQLRAAATAIEHLLAEGRHASAAALLDRLDQPAAVREAIRARVEVSAAAPAEQVGADELAGVAAFSDVPSWGSAGGNQELALALAEPLGGRLALSSPVRSIVWRTDGVLVDGTAADAVVVAVPAPVVGDIAFDPPLPEQLRGALARLGCGQAAKLFVPLRERPPASAVLSVPERYWTWTALAAAYGRLVLAGEHTAGSRAALMEGALASGARAAAQVLRLG